METRQKIPVPRRSFLWSLNETSGEILTHVGPTEFTPSANDRIVTSNQRGGYVAAKMEARPFVIAHDGEYALLRSPVIDPHDISEGPNGAYVPGGNKEKQLALGTTRIIPGPCAFPLYPGQAAEVRSAHKLGANQYLLVEVVGEVDQKAPYFDVVRASAELSSTVIAEDDEDDDEEHAGRGVKLRPGMRIVVQGRRCQLFIPPTGTEVVAAVEGDEAPSSDGMATLPAPVLNALTGMVQQVDAGLTGRQFSVLKNELRHRTDLPSHHRAIMLTVLDDTWEARRKGAQGRTGGSATRAAEGVDRYARRAVVLGPKNFCVLFDADGKPRIVRGPARVFPGPHDKFLHRGSRRRVYNAYELSERQGLWIRIVTPITKERLGTLVPEGTPLDKDTYEPGDELLVRGHPTVFFPFIECEVVNPETGEPHNGNDHDGIIIDAIGIDQKSGIYVRELETGMVKMVRGETSYMVDPRREMHVRRRVPSDKWNLWIGHAEPHKRSTHDVVTPWALSIIIPNNEAVLITSRHGRRVVVGPRTELLDYEEQLTPLRLSKGPSKDGHDTVTTCFLRVQGARVADRFELESSDYVKVSLRVGIAGRFEGEDPELWFSVEDPVKLLADVLRARLRREARRHSATKLLAELPDLIGATLFEEDGTWSFAENGMIIDHVDVLDVSIGDAELAKAFLEVQREAVSLQLSDDQARRRLASTQLRDEIDAAEHELQRKSSGRLAQTGAAEARDENTVELEKARLLEQRNTELQALRHTREAAAAEFTHTQSKARAELNAQLRKVAADSEAGAKRTVGEVELSHAESHAEVERRTAAAIAKADAVRLNAIETELVGALYAAADADVMKAAAENMNLVSLLGGRSPAELLTGVLKGTPLQRSSDKMGARAPQPEAETPSEEG